MYARPPNSRPTPPQKRRSMLRTLQQNVRGLATSAVGITKALILYQPDVVCLTETWAQDTNQSPPQWLEMGYTVHECAAKPSTGRYRSGGGVMLLTKEKTSRVDATPSDDMAIIAVQLGDTRIIGTYIKPALGKQRFNTCLDKLKSLGRGRCILLGDFNARSKLWDTGINTAGTILAAWSIQNNLDIVAPEHPTFRNPRGSSKVDLTITRGWKTSQPTVLYGPWNDNSDHVMVRAIIHKRNGILDTSTQRRIATKVLSNKHNKEIAKRFYHTALPEATANIHKSHDASSLQAATENLTTQFLKPWTSLSTKSPHRFRKGWTRQLDTKARKRTKLLRGNEKSEARRLDREIKREMRRNRRKIMSCARSSLCEKEYRTITEAMNALKKVPDRHSSIDADKFTSFFNGLQTHDSHITTQHFRVTKKFKGYLELALKSAKRGRAPGPDFICNEMLELAPTLTVEALFALWTKIGETAYTPTALKVGSLIPLLKSGNPNDPTSYRPIMLLSHLRKLISGAVGLYIRDNYVPHRFQWGFTPHTGTEDAILAADHSIRNGHTHLAVLDLRKAYDSVRRNQLLQICRETLSPELTCMISSLLETQTATTHGQQSKRVAEVTMGVPQGDRPSPDLFNIFMDTLLTQLDKIPPEMSTHVANAYADDILLLSRTQEGLQASLDIASRWGRQHNMTWNISKCTAIMPTSGNMQAYLNGVPMPRKDEAVYLGVTITSKGITDKNNQERTRNALSLFRLCSRQNTLRYHERRSLVTTYIYPKMTYAIHVVPLTVTHQHLAERLDDSILPWILGIGKCNKQQDLPRMRALTHIPSLRGRREEMMRARFRSAQKRCSDRTLPLPTRLRQQEIRTRWRQQISNPILQSTKHGEWAYANNSTRHIPGITKTGPPAMKTKDISEQTRKVAVQWYLNRFPRRGQNIHFEWLGKWRRLMSAETPWERPEKRLLAQLMAERAADVHQS